ESLPGPPLPSPQSPKPCFLLHPTARPIVGSTQGRTRSMSFPVGKPMKDHLKKLMYRAMRPGLQDVQTHLDALDTSLPPLEAKLQTTIAGLKTLYQQAQGTQDAVAQIHSLLPTLVDRLSRIERRLFSTAIWQGGLSGRAVDYAGNPIPE